MQSGENISTLFLTLNYSNPQKKNLKMQACVILEGDQYDLPLSLNLDLVSFAGNHRAEKCFLHGEEESRRDGVRSKLLGAVGVQCSVLVVLSDQTVVKPADARKLCFPTMVWKLSSGSQHLKFFIIVVI